MAPTATSSVKATRGATPAAAFFFGGGGIALGACAGAGAGDGDGVGSSPIGVGAPPAGGVNCAISACTSTPASTSVFMR